MRGGPARAPPGLLGTGMWSRMGAWLLGLGPALLRAGSLALGQHRALIATGLASCAPRLGLQMSPGVPCFVPWGALLHPLGCPAPSSLPPAPRTWCKVVESSSSSGWFGELERPRGSARRLLALPAPPPLGEDVERKDRRQKGLYFPGLSQRSFEGPGRYGSCSLGTGCPFPKRRS